MERRKKEGEGSGRGSRRTGEGKRRRGGQRKERRGEKARGGNPRCCCGLMTGHWSGSERPAACLHDFGDEKRDQHSRQVSALQVLGCGDLEAGTGAWAGSLQGLSGVLSQGQVQFPCDSAPTMNENF